MHCRFALPGTGNRPRSIHSVHITELQTVFLDPLQYTSRHRAEAVRIFPACFRLRRARRDILFLGMATGHPHGSVAWHPIPSLLQEYLPVEIRSFLPSAHGVHPSDLRIVPCHRVALYLPHLCCICLCLEIRLLWPWLLSLHQTPLYSSALVADLPLRGVHPFSQTGRGFFPVHQSGR